MDLSFHKELINIGFKFVEWVELGNLKEENLTKSRIEILNTIYYSMSDKKEIPRIEDLPPESKEQLWESVKPYVKEKSKNDQIKFSKSVYVLNELSEKKEQTESSKITKDSPERIQ